MLVTAGGERSTEKSREKNQMAREGFHPHQTLTHPSHNDGRDGQQEDSEQRGNYAPAAQLLKHLIKGFNPFHFLTS